MRALIRQLRPAFGAIIVLTIVCGIGYPLLSTLVGRTAFASETAGSLVRRDGVVVGSSLIGQTFTDPKYFFTRPSAAGAGYDGSNSSGSNLGPTNPELLTAVAERVSAYRQVNGLPAEVAVPVDAVTASASGLDPHISIANARLQAPRVASHRGLALDDVLALVDRSIDGREFGFLGEPGVNVVRLNLTLDGTRP
jgi:potassium-transporting ATPase KdpC subunit